MSLYQPEKCMGMVEACEFHHLVQTTKGCQGCLPLYSNNPWLFNSCKLDNFIKKFDWNRVTHGLHVPV